MRAKVAKGASESPRPWRRSRMAVVDSGGLGKTRETCRCGRRGWKSWGVGMRGGIFFFFVFLGFPFFVFRCSLV